MSKELMPLNDSELDSLLSAASTPPELAGFEHKLAMRLSAAKPYHDNVVQLFKPAAKPQPGRTYSRSFGIAGALAASLIVGVFVGNFADMSGFVEGLTGLSVGGQVAEFAPSGLDDVGILEEERQS